MAAIFQIRRGTSNITISDGELYLNKGIGSIQFGSGSTPVTLVILDQPNSGSLNMSGNITASNAYFSGDVAISGNLFLGNASNEDTITAGGEFTSNLIPNPTNTYTLGSSTKIWKEVHATSISGAIAATNGVISGSSQFVSVLSSLNSYTQSNDTTNTTQNTRLSRIEESTASLNAFSASENTKSETLRLYTASVDTKLETLRLYTASIDTKLSTLQTLTASTANQISRLQESTASLNAFSASENTKSETLRLYTASVDLTIARLRESTASLNEFSASENTKSETLRLYTASVDLTIARLRESTASLNLYTQSNDTTNTTQNTRLSRIEESTSSLNVFSASNGNTSLNSYTQSNNTTSNLQITRIDQLAAATASVNSFTASNGNTSLNSFTSAFNTAIQLTGSNVNIAGNLIVAGTTTQISSTQLNIGDNIIELNGTSVANGGLLIKDPTGGATVSGSLLWDSTNDYWKAGALGSELKILRTGGDSVVTSSQQVIDILTSLNTFSASNGNTSLNSYTGSIDTLNSLQTTRIDQLAAATASINNHTASVTGHIADINTKTGSFEARFNRLQESTASINNHTASVTGHIADINTKTGSFEARFNRLQESTSSLNSVSASTLIRLSRIEESTSSLNLFSASVSGHITDINTKTGSYATTGSNSFNGNQWITGSLSVSQNITGSVSASFAALSVGTPTPSQKIHFKGLVGLENGTTGGNTADQIIFGYNGSSLSQYNHKIQTGHDAQAALNRMDFLIADGAQTQKNILQLRHDRVITNGSAYITGSLIVTGSIIGTIAATNGVVSGSSQISYVGLSNIPAGIVSGSSQIPALLPTGVISSSAQLPAGLVSGSVQVIGILNPLNTFSASINAFYNQFTASAVGFSASVDGRLDQLEYTASYGSAATIADQFGTLTNVTASLQRASASLQEFTASQNIKFETLRLYTASVDTKFTTLQSLTASNLNRLSRIEESTASLNSYTSSNDTTNTTQNTRLSRIEESTASLNLFTQSLSTTYEGRASAVKTIFSGSSQVSYVGLSDIPSGIISSSAQIDTLFNIDGIVSGSSQVSYTGLSNIPSGIISSSAQIDTLFNIDGIVSGSSQINFTQLSGISANIISASSDTSNVDMIITGGSISANLYGGVVSGSAQVTTILTSLNSFSASNGNTSLNAATSSYETTGRSIVSGSSQVNFTQLSGISNGIVSSSAQITPLLPSGVLSGSNQTNITSINQNLGTSTTGVQFASLGIGTAPDATYELKIQGDVAASGDIVAYYTSDKRLKDNIQPIQNALDKVNELGGYTFDWNEELQKARKGHDIGVIAQEVQSTFPEVVVERDNGYLGVDYQKLVPVLIEAIKELSAKVKELENK